MRIVCRILRININDRRYSLLCIVVIFIVLSLQFGASCFNNFDCFSKEGLSAFFSAMMQVSFATVAVSVAILAIFYSNLIKNISDLKIVEESADYHWFILHSSNGFILIVGCILVVLNGLCLPLEYKWLRCVTVGSDLSYIIVFLGIVYGVLRKDWWLMVEKSMTKNVQYVEIVKKLKDLFRKLCSELDSKFCDTESYYSQVDRLQFLSKDERKYLKKLNDLVDDTKIGSRIKNPEEVLRQLESIIDKLR